MSRELTCTYCRKGTVVAVEDVTQHSTFDYYESLRSGYFEYIDTESVDTGGVKDLICDNCGESFPLEQLKLWMVVAWADGLLESGHG